MSTGKITLSIRTALIVIAVSILGKASSGFSCSTFSYVDGARAYVGKSYDWDKEQGVLHINKRGVKKSSLQVFPTDRPLNWTSKYGSLTLNQYGREIPNAGINEAGLVVEVMVLDDARFPSADDKPSVNESQWVQYMLDMAGSVSDVVELAEKNRLSKILIPLHYVACDSTGSCVAIEPIGGKLVVTDLTARGNKVLTNDSYESSMKNLQGYKGFGGSKPIPTSKGSMDRFVIASDHIKNASNAVSDPVAFGFEGVERVANGATKWKLVYDAEGRKLHFSTISAPEIKTVEMKAFKFDCKNSVKVYDMNHGASGDVSAKFKEYSAEVNAQLVRKSLGRSVPEELIQAAIALPDSTECVQ